MITIMMDKLKHNLFLKVGLLFYLKEIMIMSMFTYLFQNAQYIVPYAGMTQAAMSVHKDTSWLEKAFVKVRIGLTFTYSKYWIVTT